MATKYSEFESIRKLQSFSNEREDSRGVNPRFTESLLCSKKLTGQIMANCSIA